MNILKSLSPITRRANRIHYVSPSICVLADIFSGSGSGSGAVDTIDILPTFRVAGPALSASVDGTQVHLSWDRVTGAYAYIIYRSTSAEGPFVAIVTGLIARTTIDNPGAGTFFYRVTAIEPNFGESTPSNTVSVTV